VISLRAFVAAVTSDETCAFIAAVLHVLSPAGLFLSAPNPEASFSAWSFAGICLLVWRYKVNSAGLSDAITLLAGFVFEQALRHRSNGIFNGIPIAVAFFQAGTAFVKDRKWEYARELLVLGVAGAWTLLAILEPQVQAFLQYCSPQDDTTARPWCSARIPSIYSFVQSHYW
jgi:GPI mannosyltransferase 2